MRRFITLLPLALVVASAPPLLSRCVDDEPFTGGDGAVDAADGAVVTDLGPLPDSYVNPCAPKPPPTVTGRVLAPNGTDPVAGALVGVPLALRALPDSVQCERCSLAGKFSAFVYADSDGRFELKGVPNTGKPFKISLQKGYFRRVVQVTVPPCGKLALTDKQSTLPGKMKQYGPQDTIPRIGVVTGAWDQLEKVLDKLGVTEMKVYNGKDLGTGPQSMQWLLENGALMQQYHLLFINCGVKFEGLVTSPGPARSNLRAYVHKGGRLFVTDYSYDFVEQTFPEFINFEGGSGTAANKPEPHNAAELGSEGLKLEGSVLDNQLKSWLGLKPIGALLPNKKVQIVGLQTAWAVQKSVTKQGGKVWVEAPVTFIGGRGVRPLTSSYDYRGSDTKGCGRVIFSSYHTHGKQQTLLPQERILEYLMLEIGACVKVK